MLTSVMIQLYYTKCHFIYVFDIYQNNLNGNTIMNKNNMKLLTSGILIFILI